MPLTEPPRVSDVSELRNSTFRLYRLWVWSCRAVGIEPAVIETIRTPERQEWLYGSGRPDYPEYGRPGPILTSATAENGRHVASSGQGRAWDFWFLRPAHVLPEHYAGWVWSDEAPWAAAGSIGAALGLVWGGSWQSRDLGHLEDRL